LHTRSVSAIAAQEMDMDPATIPPLVERPSL
jgi:hypothetical protein